MGKVRSTFEEKMNKVKEKSTEIIKKFDDFKTSVKTVFEAVKSKVEETIKPVIDLIQNFTDKIRAAISAVKDFLQVDLKKWGRYSAEYLLVEDHRIREQCPRSRMP